jgi:glycosyltransferase involved in cell wall biosynthesis
VHWLTKGLGRGGAEQLLCELVPEIDRTRFTVEVAYVLPWKDALVTTLEAMDIPVHCLGGGRVRWIARLRSLCRRQAYDIVHTHMPLPGAAARLVVPRTSRFVHTEHNLWARYRWPTRVANRATFERNASVVAVSQAVADSIAPPRRGRGVPVEVVRHGIGATAPVTTAEARRRLGIDAGVPVIGTVGTLSEKKDQRTLIAAFALVLAEHPDALLVLVGGGPLEADLRAQVAAAGIRDRVMFAGLRDDVPEILYGFDVFAMSSRHEGLPIALVEALAAGVPSVVTHVGGIGEVIEDGREGFLVPPADPAALAGAITRLLDDPDLRAAMGERATARAEDFSIAPAAERIQEIYEEVLAR